MNDLHQWWTERIALRLLSRKQIDSTNSTTTEQGDLFSDIERTDQTDAGHTK